MYNRNERYWKIPVHPDHILEIRLKPEIWARVVQIADRKDCSYSWVVRYCVFRMIKRKDPRRYVGNCIVKNNSVKFEKMDAAAREHIGDDNLHRHKLCLYEEDEFFIRMTAGLMHCTMSHLVRLALEWNLDELERLSNGRSSLFHDLAFYWLGIKLYHGVVFPTMDLINKDFRLDRLNEHDYW
ncbi:MAG: hypothetical protein ABUK01_14510 [Leptospirales bacterium]